MEEKRLIDDIMNLLITLLFCSVRQGLYWICDASGASAQKIGEARFRVYLDGVG